MSDRVLARIGKPHGIRGEVTVQAHTDDPAARFVPPRPNASGSVISIVLGPTLFKR